jgi:hypothetical protein
VKSMMQEEVTAWPTEGAGDARRRAVKSMMQEEVTAWPTEGAGDRG